MTFSQEGVFVLDGWFFTDEAWFQLSRYINSENRKIWSAENPHALHANSLHLSKMDFGAQWLGGEKKLWEHISLKRLEEGTFLACAVITHCSRHSCYI
jgi:hypothetical protein